MSSPLYPSTFFLHTSPTFLSFTTLTIFSIFLQSLIITPLTYSLLPSGLFSPHPLSLSSLTTHPPVTPHSPSIFFHPHSPLPSPASLLLLLTTVRANNTEPTPLPSPPTELGKPLLVYWQTHCSSLLGNTGLPALMSLCMFFLCRFRRNCWNCPWCHYTCDSNHRCASLSHHHNLACW